MDELAAILWLEYSPCGLTTIRVAGKKAYVTTAVPANSIACCDFSKFVIAFFGKDAPVQLIVNPYTNARAGKIEFVCHIYADCGLLRPQCAAINTDSAVQ